MNEIERIHKMVEAGTITDAEAERLLSVLREIDQADGELAASEAAMEAEARRAVAGPGDAPASEAVPAAPAGDDAARPAGTPTTAAPTGPAPTGAAGSATGPTATGGSVAGPAAAGRPAGAQTHAGTTDNVAADTVTADTVAADTVAADNATASAPEGTRWVHVALLAGDLSLRADPNVTEVVVRGDTDSVRVEPSADGFTVRHVKDDGQDSWVDRFLSRIRSGHVELRVPTGTASTSPSRRATSRSKASRSCAGVSTSGDLDARGLRGIDFTTAAGDLDLEMTLTEGRHRLRATAGDVNVRLGAGSDVAVDGSVSIGSASVRAPGFDTDRRGVGQRFQGRVGEGKAQFDVHVTTGDVHVKVDA